MANVTLVLGALTCPSCLKKIKGALAQTKGVQDVRVLFNAGKAKVRYDSQVVTPEELSDIVKKLGYEVKQVQI
ncbi:hypothetical protein FC83_GL000525 [Agrilactobacillus composti DSM 18527 = JCM 14202]|uniref:Copper chaperone CopZ n=1 Tax=Agrilactobacillus composti DSM 18527 = JCM 14202 TaxID=1423734 RepID=X0PVP0_9LACO|nr:heavy-metal-associated domain-containing protein [Agrilactobacillus composti]KRM35967.1 hypothetical protein FC83_GL000525 [Agrilactobacillus composti DSM 18527 = JCM 14202]GAF41551.1 copper chaperone [Agrilactobacillus composti DSM 18527 = JCM 14202]